jgi:hypothetical protein
MKLALILFPALVMGPSSLMADINLLTNGSFETVTTEVSGGTAGACNIGGGGGWTCSFGGSSAGGNVGANSVTYSSNPYGFGAVLAPPDNAISVSPDLVGTHALYLVDDGATNQGTANESF